MTHSDPRAPDPLRNSSTPEQSHPTQNTQPEDAHPLFPFTPPPQATATTPASAPATHFNASPYYTNQVYRTPQPTLPDAILMKLVHSIDSLNGLLNNMMITIDDIAANQETIIQRLPSHHLRSRSPTSISSNVIPDTIETSVAATSRPHSSTDHSIAASNHSVAASIAHSAHSAASAAALQHLFEDQKNRAISIEPLKFKLEDKPYLRAWLKRLFATVQSHRFFGFLISPSGNFKEPPPTDYDKLFYNALYAALPEQLQSIVRLNNQLESSGVATYLYLQKVAAPLTTNNHLADQFFDEMKALRFDPKSSNIWEFGTTFAEAVEKLKGTIHEMSEEAILSRWILSLPSNIFRQLQHEFQDAGTLPPTWIRTGQISVLLSQTESYIQKHHPLLPSSSAAKSQEPKPKIHHPPPAGFASRDAWKSFLTSKIGKPYLTVLLLVL